MKTSVNKNATKVVYLVRHGQSVDNVSPVFQSAQTPLSEEGIKQAEFIAKRLKSVKFDVVLASPLPRAKKTAEIIAEETGHEVEFNDLLVERIKPTSIDGKPYTDEKANKVWHDWEESMVSLDVKIEDGENYTEHMSRVDDVLEMLYNRPEKTLLVVSHGYILRSLVLRVLLKDEVNNKSFKNFQYNVSIENTAISALVYEPRYGSEADWRVWLLNDHAHLAD